VNEATLVEETVVRLMRTATTTLPVDVLAALERALAEETEEIAKAQLRTILENARLAEEGRVPMCQDTGVPIFYVSGLWDEGLEAGIRQGVARATREVPLRANVVHPLTRHNTGDNLGEGMPVVHFSPPKGDFIEITHLPKGAGSENMSALRMLNPSEGAAGIKRTVLDVVTRAGGRPCPPTIVGLGVGGTAEGAAHLAKRALLRPVGRRSPDPEAARLEEDLEHMLNRTGVGPMGLGGRTTVIGVSVELAHCHTASLPVAINLQCWAARRCSARIFSDGRVLFRTEGFE
jgi:fumarate hydratase subunit alpha